MPVLNNRKLFSKKSIAPGASLKSRQLMAYLQYFWTLSRSTPDNSAIPEVGRLPVGCEGLVTRGILPVGCGGLVGVGLNDGY